MAPSEAVQTIHIPPDTAHVAAIRAFIGAVGRHTGCSDETIEDLRLAVTEACGQALEQDAAPDGIDLRTSLEADRLTVEIEPTGTFERTGGDASADLARWELIAALFPEADLRDHDGLAVLRLTAQTG